MAYDLIVKGGTVVDGSGLPGFRADVGIKDGMIARIGDLKGERAEETLDAEGHVVSPGFIDAHTHMDAQIFWDKLGTNVCWNGVTSVVMGNCGYTLAPCAEKDKRLVFSNFERAEEISPAAMEAGIPWSWETVPELLDTMDRMPKGINYGTHVGHSALRSYVMGQRAFTDKATDDDLAAMKKHVEVGLKAGALGFTTARSSSHRTAEGKPVASRVADWSEILELTKVMTKLNSGVFQLARGVYSSNDPDEQRRECEDMMILTLESRRPVAVESTWYRRAKPNDWRRHFTLIDEATARGGKMMILGSSTWSGSMRSFETVTPFDKFPVWSDFRQLPLNDQIKGLRDPAMRKKLVDAANNTQRSNDPSLPNYLLAALDWDWIFPYENPLPPHRSVADVARDRKVDPTEAFIDLCLEEDLKTLFFSPSHNEDENFVLALIRHPNTGITFSDAGAHVATTINPVQSYLLGYWVRERQEMTMEAAIRKMTFDLAAFWSLPKRGMLREGWHADVTVFDPRTIAPQKPTLVRDLPTGAARMQYKADGIKATIVNGQVFMRNNEHTGVYAGQLMRGALAR
jgi:N-acyl-D-amino-acid deacylase